VGLTFVMPKFMPLTVSMDDPVWAALGKSTRVTTGESYVKVLRLVPAIEPRLSATEETSPAPAASLHVIELAVVQVDVAQIVLQISWVSPYLSFARSIFVPMMT